MNGNGSLTRYNYFLVVVLIVLIGASLAVTAAVGLHLRENARVSERDRILYRNQLVQLQLDSRITMAQRWLAGLAGTTRGVSSREEIRHVINHLNSDTDMLPGSEWRLIDPARREILAANHEGLHADSVRYAPPADPAMTLYREDRGATPRGAITFGDKTVVGDGLYPVLLFDFDVLVDFLGPFVSSAPVVTILDWSGNRILTATIAAGGFEAVQTNWDEAGFPPEQSAPPYRGGAAVPPIQLQAIRTHLVVEDSPDAPLPRNANPVAAVIVTGLILYGLIIVLAFRYRRTLLRHARTLDTLSKQKGLLFSLLSHNLKNNLAAIAAEAHTVPGSHKILAPVGDASRIVSNALYFLQFQEGTYQSPALEAVDLTDLLEFLTLRCEVDASAKLQTIRTETPDSPCPVGTNLTMALEALERIVVNAIQYSPESKEIVVRATCRESTAEITITDRGPGLSRSAKKMFETPLLPREESALPGGENLRGIGVYVARRILESLGAELRLIDTSPEGTCVGIIFPLTTKH